MKVSAGGQCRADGTDEEKTNGEEAKRGNSRRSILTHGLQHLRHLPSNDPVCHMTHSEAPTAVFSLHRGGVVRAYHPDGQLRATFSSPVEFTGLTGTRLQGRVAAWGPGASLALLDSELQPLACAAEPLDVRTCQAAEETRELVTAGAGNVCVWCLDQLTCKVRVEAGLGQDDVFTMLALAPPIIGANHRAFAACGSAVALFDLTEGRLLQRRKDLHLREITSLVHCPLLDCLVTASRDTSIRVWDPDWDPLITFESHTGVVMALVCCPLTGQIISASLDGSLRCWSLVEGEQVQEVRVEGGAPLALGGPGEGGVYHSFSECGVDFWSMNRLHHLLCMLSVETKRGGPLWQIAVPRCPKSYPSRALCVCSDKNLTLVAVETGAVLSSFCLGAGQTVRAADYCLYRETLLVLTGEGEVLTASTLTNPATAQGNWRGAWEEPWPDGEGDACGQEPGRASCLALYSAVTDPQEALQDWETLQKLGDLKVIKRRSRLDLRNWFLVMLGQEGGCVSVLKWGSGGLLSRTPAHSRQNVTALLADPGNGNLYSAGEDRTVQVWKVSPLPPDCLSPLHTVSCGLVPVRLAALGPLLAVALQEPLSAPYCLLQIHLPSLSTSHPAPSQEHQDSICGLCACPKLGVLASSGRDGTIHIWADENHLLRILQLNAVPESLSYCEHTGDLLLGIRGDLYRIPKTHLLPPDLHTQLLCVEQLDPVVDVPVCEMTDGSLQSISGVNDCVENESHAPADKGSDTENSRTLQARNRDLQDLQQGAVLCNKKQKPLATRRMKKEAFSRYLKLVFREPRRIEIPREMDDSFGPQWVLFPPGRPSEPGPPTPHGVRLRNTAAKRCPLGCVPNSVALAQLWPDKMLENAVPQRPWPVTEGLSMLSETRGHDVDDDDGDEGDDAELKLQQLLEKRFTPPRQATPPPPSPPPVVENVRPRIKVPKRPLNLTRPKPNVPPPPIPKPPTPSPPPPPAAPPRQRPPPLTPPRPPPPPSPPRAPRETPPPQCPIPEFLSPFVDQGWFQEVFPDHSRLLSSLSPESFALLLLQNLRRCQPGSRKHILNALLQLLQQEALMNRKQVLIHLIELLRSFATSDMSKGDKDFVCELLRAVVSVSSESTDTVLLLLTVLAQRDLGLQSAVLRLLKLMGLDEADPWLSSEVASWHTGTPGEPEGACAHLAQAAARWLDYWTCKYENRAQVLKGTERQKLFTAVDVLKFFCSVQRENQNRSPPPPPRRRDTVLRPHLSLRKPVLRLGETHSLVRARQTQRVTLPPLPRRPPLEGFVPLVSFPLPRIILCPFCLQNQRWPRGALQRRYFIPERSCIQYYR